VACSYDLIVATVDRIAELRQFFESLARQTHGAFRVLLVDQNEDDRLDALVREQGFELVHLRSPRGLSTARNVALPHVAADLVAFPDDDCVYPDELLEHIAARFESGAPLDGLTGRGAASPSWARDASVLTRENLWNRAISYAIFLRRQVVERVGRFDERLGLPASSGEEIDYLVRALDLGVRIEYDPSLVVSHGEEGRDLMDIAVRDGKSIGYILRKHRYRPRTVARMLARPAGGALLAALRKDGSGARVHAATLRGRVAGYVL
jgi:glycosyltransferase involved in cell wall biosynthesis